MYTPCLNVCYKYYCLLHLSFSPSLIPSSLQIYECVLVSSWDFTVYCHFVVTLRFPSTIASKSAQWMSSVTLLKNFSKQHLLVKINVHPFSSKVFSMRFVDFFITKFTVDLHVIAFQQKQVMVSIVAFHAVAVVNHQLFNFLFSCSNY